MKHLIRPKIGFGMLIMLILVFSVQGIADALTFKESRTGDLQTLLPNDTFTIKFSVNLTSPKDIFDTNMTPKRQEDEAGDDIDSSGYEVTLVDNTYYRNIPDPAPIGEERDGFRDPEDTETGRQSATAAYVDTSGNAVDNEGRKIYENATGSTRLKVAPASPKSDSLQHHYNDEAILVSVSGGTITSLKRNNTDIPWVTSGTAARRTAVDAAQVDDTDTPTYSLIEETKNRQLDNDRTLTSSQITLTGQVSAVGTYTIKIFDVTHEADFPANDFPATQAILTFTIYVVPAAERATDLTRTAANAEQFSNDLADLQINNLFGFTAVLGSETTNLPIIYEVQGSGSVYVEVTYDDGSPDSKSSSMKRLETSNAAPVYLDMGGGSSKVTAWLRGQNPNSDSKSIACIYDYAQLEIIHGNNQVGATGGRLEEHLGVEITDAKDRPVPGLRVTFDAAQDDASFIPFPGTTVYASDSRTLDTAINDTDSTTVATSSSPDPTSTSNDDPIYVQTDSRGEAKVYYQLGANADNVQDVNVTAAGASDTFVLTADDDARRASLQIVSMEQPSGAGKEGVYYLTVIARSVGGHRIPNVIIEFEALSGSIRPRPGTGQPLADGTGNPGTLPTGTTVAESGNEIFVVTGSDGEAEVEYNVGPTDATKIVTAEVHDEQGSLQYDFILDRVTFDVRNATSSRPDTSDDDDDDDDFVPPTLTVSETSITGRPGSTHDITITASRTAQVGGNFFDQFVSAGGSASPSSGINTFTSTLTLPSTEGTYDLVVSMGSERRTVRVTVSGTAPVAQTGGTLRLSANRSGAPGALLQVTVTATDSDGDPASGVSVELRVTNNGGTFSPATVTTGTNGSVTSTLTLGRAAGDNYFIRATAASYDDDGGLRVTITGTQQPSTGSQPPLPPTTAEAGEPDDIAVHDGDNQRGIPNTRLPEPLVVRVVDVNNDPVNRERVTFRTTRGSGQFTQDRPRTNSNGLAQTRFTPTSSGDIQITVSVDGVATRVRFDITVGAAPASLTKVSGDSQSGTPDRALANPFVVEVKDADGEAIEDIRVTFSVTEGGGRLSVRNATTDEDGRAETTLTLGSQVGINSVEANVSGVDPVTFNTSIEPEIHVAAAKRPVMYWIDNGMLYRLAGNTASRIADSVNGFAVGSDTLYWTSTTGASSGTINSANLDGSDATVLNTIRSVPIGIAVDAAHSKLYWTNSRGKIQSATLKAAGIKSVVQNLSNPTDIVVSNGFIYWIEDGDSIQRATMNAQRTKQDVAVNLDTVGGIAVGGGKVYWTEMATTGGGTINRANLNGTQFSTLKTLGSAPIGIAVDTEGGKLYWTNARGRVQSGSLTVGRVTNVVSALIAPSQLGIGGANMEMVVEQPTQPASGGDTSPYDVNGDGTVDNTDAALVAGAMETDNTQYDVNGDGTVNFLDLLLIFDNRSEGAAGAPTVVGMQLSALQVDVIEEQIDLLIATGDRSPVAMRTLVYLQQLIATARPEKTQLFANFPNPFNPETWIPYELATDTDVRITIYTAQGVVIRTLQLGQQSAGYYTDRERAAYWDGRNAFGEQVASGVYFYQLETDTMSALRKMVILK